MAQQFINVGTTANDGQGDPLRTAFTKCNDNFTEVYAATYNTIINGSSSVNVLQDSAVTFTVAGTSNIAVVSTNGVSVTGNVYAGNVVTTYQLQGTTVVAGSNITGGNLLTGGLVSATGNITGSVVKGTGAFMVMPTGASDPAGAVAGAFYFNTGNSKVRVYNGSSWVNAA